MSAATKAAPIADAGGAVEKPPAAPIVATTEPPPVICPETNSPCLELPQCDLRRLRSVYCVRWVARIRAEGAAELTKARP